MAHKYSMVFRYDEAIRQALEAVRERDGASFHEQVRRAVVVWLTTKGMPPPEAPLADRHVALAARAWRLSQDLAAAAEVEATGTTQVNKTIMNAESGPGDDE